MYIRNEADATLRRKYVNSIGAETISDGRGDHSPEL